MTIPNLITIARLVIVPLVIVMIVQGDWQAAFFLFVLAGISDGVDGFIARRFDMRSEFGAYIDPLADKALLTRVLTYHVLDGRVLKAGVPLNTPIATKNGDAFTVDSSLSITDQRGRKARITGTDVLASNGVIHIIDKVILPRS